MKLDHIASITLIMIISSGALATSNLISGKKMRIGTVEDGVQYVKKGTQYLDLVKWPVVVALNDSDGSIEVFAPNLAPIDSAYFRFIPGNLISVRLSVEVTWDENLSLFHYSYTLISDASSLRPIELFETEWINYYWETESPDKWNLLSIPQQGRNGWATIGDHNMIMPGNSKSGFGFLSAAPPVMATFKVRGKTENLVYRFSEKYEEILGNVEGKVKSMYRSVEGLTIVPGICPERIEPVQWISHAIYFKLDLLMKNGYIDQKNIDNIRMVVANLVNPFKSKENHSTEKLEQEINTTLAALAPYQDQMEPEAWAFITENLKYVLRHLDIVQFKEYP
jgi:hypothetical protein